MSEQFKTCEEAKQGMLDDINVYYHRQRLDSKPGYLSPSDFEEKKWLSHVSVFYAIRPHPLLTL